GSTLVAAAKWHRRYAGYDLDADFVEIARRRVADELRRRSPRPPTQGLPTPAPITASLSVEDDDDFQARATREGKAAQAIAPQVPPHFSTPSPCSPTRDVPVWRNTRSAAATRSRSPVSGRRRRSPGGADVAARRVRGRSP